MFDLVEIIGFSKVKNFETCALGTRVDRFIAAFGPNWVHSYDLSILYAKIEFYQDRKLSARQKT